MFLFSCQTHYTKNKIILQAEALLDSNPDSASSLLSTIQHPEDLTECDYAAWCLHYTHAQYKLNKVLTSDSLIHIAVEYYDKSNLSKYSGTAYYLHGCILRTEQRNKMAMEAFKEAENILQLTEENDLKGLIDFNIAYIYMQDELYNQALKYFINSLHYFQLSKNIKYQAYAFRSISDMYFQLNYPLNKVLNYSNLALKASKQIGDSINYYSILARQGELLYNKDAERSKEYILQGFKYFPESRPYYAAILSYIYSVLNKADSAYFYNQISINENKKENFNNIKNLACAYLAKNQGNNALAFKYFEKAYSDRDSIFQQRFRSQLYRIDKQYDVSKKEEENTKLRIGNRNNVIVITMLLIIVLLISVVILFLKNRHKKKLGIISKEKQQLEFAVQLKQIENNQKRELLLSKLHNRIDNTLRINQLKMNILNPEKQVDFMKEISTQSILEKEWQYYIDELNQLYDGKLVHLLHEFPKMTQSDLVVVALICLNIDITDCCSLMNMNINTLYVRRKRIKIHLGLNKDENLEDWIKSKIN